MPTADHDRDPIREAFRAIARLQPENLGLLIAMLVACAERAGNRHDAAPYWRAAAALATRPRTEDRDAA